MSTSDLLGGPLAQAIGLALLHALWQGAIVAGMTAASSLCSAAAAPRCATRSPAPRWHWSSF